IEALLSEVMPEGADDAGQKGEDADEAGPDGDEPGGDGGVRDGGARDGRARDGAGAGQSEDHDPVDEDA
ncbi:MAG: hypothetical protein GWN85_43215, partial [Gemmatimonadetes bacterium]|nr:hypothetical protein [Gemmatimonadota bacterium]NIR42065.1 hypothetical protein [Actinomycetota bacterium]NIT85609.1 hypothetical protein [Gemmatimonadota bacterium]NIU71661.1 hypothetical protein [Actinomycetota bacterium]NIW33613.1 hypothetical protein [Actinomycetota bacterium]